MRNSPRFSIGVMAGLALFTIALIGAAQSIAKETDLTDLPERVHMAAQKIFGAETYTYDSEPAHEMGTSGYEVEGMTELGEVSVRLTKDGAILSKERSIEPSTLPVAVTQAINETYPNAKIEEAESLEIFMYEVEVVVDGKEHEVLIFPDGSFHGKPEVEDEDADDDQA